MKPSLWKIVALYLQPALFPRRMRKRRPRYRHPLRRRVFARTRGRPARFRFRHARRRMPRRAGLATKI